MSILSGDSAPFSSTKLPIVLSLLLAAITSYVVVSIKINVTGMAVGVLKCRVQHLSKECNC